MAGPVDDHRFYRTHTGDHWCIRINGIKIQFQTLILLTQKTDDITQIR